MTWSSPPRATTSSTRRSQRSAVRARPSGSAEAFEDRRHTLAATDAHRLETERLVLELQPVDQRAGDARAGHAERVADGDRTAVHVEAVDVDAELLVRRDHLRGERLVDLDEVDVVDRHLRASEGLLGGLDRTETHDLRRQAGDTGRHDAGEWRDAELLRLRVAHDDDRGGAVVERARVARSDPSVRTEHRLQLSHPFDSDPGARAIVLLDHPTVGQCHRRDLALPETVRDRLLGEVL